MKLMYRLLLLIIIFPQSLIYGATVDYPQVDSTFTFNLINESWELASSNTEMASIKLDSALYFAKAIDNKFLVALASDRIGCILVDQGKWGEAVEALNKALQIQIKYGWYAKSGETELHLGKLYSSEGALYKRDNKLLSAQKAFRLSLKHYKLALKYFLSAGDSANQAKAIANIGGAHYSLEEYDLAAKNYRLAMRTFERRSMNLELANVQTNIGTLYMVNNNSDSASYFYRIARKHFHELQNFQNLISLDINFAILHENENPSDAVRYLMEADSLSILLGDVVQRAYIQEFLYSIYKASGNTNLALSHLEAYHQIKSGLLTSEFKDKELAVRYEAAKQRELIEKQKSENLEKELLIANAEKEREFLILLVILIGLGILALTIFYFWRQRLNRIISNQKEKLHKNELKHLSQQKDLATAQALLNGQERERSRIAEDLHDKVGCTLVAARMQFEAAMEEGQASERFSHLNKAHLLLDQAIEETRNTSHNLISGVLVKLGLKAALADLRDSLQISGSFQVYLKLDEIPKLTSDQELHIFRIAQELMSNVIKHSKANKILIQLYYQNNTLYFEVSDNGIGINIPNSAGRGLGLANIGRRADSLNATWSIEDVPGKGTKFRMQTPLPNANMESMVS